LDIALESGHVIKPSNGWYSKVNMETGEVEDQKFREKDTNTRDFWMPILKQESFQNFIKNKYQVAAGEIIQSEEEENAI
jgi:myosin-crossreactive antigen